MRLLDDEVPEEPPLVPLPDDDELDELDELDEPPFPPPPPPPLRLNSCFDASATSLIAPGSASAWMVVMKPRRKRST